MRGKKFNRICGAALAASLGVLLTAGMASAAPITIGSSLQGSFSWPTPVSVTGSFVNTRLAGGNGKLLSPVDGAVIGWRVSEGFEGANFRLQVVDPVGTYGDEYKGGVQSAPVRLSMVPPARFTTNLPIKKGEGIGLVAEANSILGVRLKPSGGALYESFDSILGGDAAPGTRQAEGEELGFNAEILPAPTVAGISPTSGAAAGGTKVTITGTDFAKVTGVSFGATAAASYKVESEGKIVATAPAGSAGKAVRVSVTTVAGTASAAGKFTYAPKTAKPKTAKGKKG